jgi:RNA polymerase sigma-70 factor, ECF subfamily
MVQIRGSLRRVRSISADLAVNPLLLGEGPRERDWARAAHAGQARPWLVAAPHVIRPATVAGNDRRNPRRLASYGRCLCTIGYAEGSGERSSCGGRRATAGRALSGRRQARLRRAGSPPRRSPLRGRAALGRGRRRGGGVTQEAFLRAWRSIGRFEFRSRFFTWLCRIGINEPKRRAERRPPIGTVASIEDSPIEDAADWSEAPDFRAAQGQLRAVLEDAVRALPLEYRAPLILRDVEGLSTQEAAEVMELGEAAFKSRLHRARLAVRRAVDEYYLEGER